MKRATTITAAVAVVVVGVVGLAAYRAAKSERSDRSDLLHQTATVEVRAADFYIALPVQGDLEAARSVPIVCISQGETQIVSVLADGVRVKAGDVIMKLNATETKKNVDRLLTETADAEDRVKQQEAQSQKQVQNARSSLSKARESLRLAAVESQAGIEKAQAEVAFLEKELDVAQGQLDKRKRLLEERLLPITEVEAAEDELRDKQFAMETAKRTLARAEVDATTTQRLREMDVKTAEIELAQAEANLVTAVAIAQRDLAQKQSDLAEAQEQLDNTEVKAPTSGMLLLDVSWEEEGVRPLRVGDRVWDGRRVANIIDPTQMRLNCDISEADIELVRVGQPAEVRVAAIGSRSLTGKVRSVDNLARERSPWEGGAAGTKAFSAVIQLTSADRRLRPGMGGSVDILLERVRTGLAVPLEALFLRDGKYVVYRAEGHSFRPTPVRVLKRNNEFAAVAPADAATPLRRGDRVARLLPPPSLLATAQGKAP
ncbi:MAG: HlyD family secretion protein [Armatimonadota bacterium]